MFSFRVREEDGALPRLSVGRSVALVPDHWVLDVWEVEGCPAVHNGGCVRVFGRAPEFFPVRIGGGVQRGVTDL